MRRVSMVLAVCGIAAALLIGSGGVEAQVRRRPLVSRAPIAVRPIQRRGAVGGGMTQGPEQTGPVTPGPGIPEPGIPEPVPPEAPALPIQQTVTLRSDVAPANGPENAQGVAILNHTAEGILLESGTVTISGLSSGTYDVWVVFSDPLLGQDLLSQLAARLTVAQENEQTEAVMLLGTLVGREYGTLRQIVITAYSDTGVDVGGEPVSGGAGQPGWSGTETAQLAANVQPPTDNTSEPQRAIRKRAVDRRTLPLRRNRIRSIR